MPKRRRRSFTPQFKAQVVLEVLAGIKTPSEVARQHKLKPELISRWKDVALEGLESLFQGDDQRSRPTHGCLGGACELPEPRGRSVPDPVPGQGSRMATRRPRSKVLVASVESASAARDRSIRTESPNSCVW